jgi:hypothetical protein
VKTEWGQEMAWESDYQVLYQQIIDSVDFLNKKIEQLSSTEVKRETTTVTNTIVKTEKSTLTKSNKDGVFVYANTGAQYNTNDNSFDMPSTVGIRYKTKTPVFISTEVQKTNTIDIYGNNYNFKANVGIQF